MGKMLQDALKRPALKGNSQIIDELRADNAALVKALRNCCDRLKMDLDEIQHLRGWLSDSEMAERADQDEVADEADKSAIAEANRVLGLVGGPAK